MASWAGVGFGNPDDQVLVPITTGRFRLFGSDRLRSVSVLAETEDKIPDAMAGADDVGPDRGEPVPMVGVDDELEGPGLRAACHLGVADGMVVPRFPGDQAREPLAPALHQVQPLVLTQGPVAVHRLGHVEEGGDGSDVAPPHLALDLDAWQGHGRKLATESLKRA